MSDAHVNIRDVIKTYRISGVETSALRGVSASIERGAFVSFTGSSGSGKTTLLNLIAGFDRPSSGSIQVGPLKVSELADFELSQYRKTTLGFIFQNFNLLPVLSALENVEYPLLKMKLSSVDRSAKARLALESVGLGSYLIHRPAQMSGGQRQRVAIARAIVHDPELILADEPTANLDSQTGLEILHLLLKISQERKVTTIIATHDPQVMTITRHSIHLSDGRLKNA